MQIKSLPTMQVFILCRNRPDYARQAIESALRQTSGQFDLIISDNSSDDSVANMVREHFPSVEYRRRGNVPVLAHLNACLSEITADYVCLFHDDDLLAPNFVERVLGAIQQHPGAVAIGVNAWMAEEGEAPALAFENLGLNRMIRRSTDLADRYYSRHQTGIAPFPGYVYSVARLGDLRFDEFAGKYGDVSWLLRVADRGEIVWISEPLMTYRLHATNDGRTESIRDRLRLFGYFKKHESQLGRGLIGDFRFFLYKKLFELQRKGLRRLPLRRQRLLRAYVMRYRVCRFGRLDHHAAFFRKLAIRLASRRKHSHSLSRLP